MLLFLFFKQSLNSFFFKVNSLKEAIDVTLHKYDYNRDNTDIINKLITNALNENFKVFTSHPINSREYVINLGRNGVLKEMLSVTNSKSTDINEIIYAYIDKCFKKKNTEDRLFEIEANSDLDKITKKIRYISTVSENDIDFQQKLWSYFSDVFVGKDYVITADEIRFDMLQAALSKAESTRDNVTVLKNIDPMSKEMTEMDAVTLVEEYVYDNNIEQLMDCINNNQIFSGLLLQNLFDYTYFKKEERKTAQYELDNVLSDIKHPTVRAHVIYQIMTTGIKGYNISREEAIIEVIKNTLALNVYINNRNSVDYNEEKLYTGDIERGTLSQDKINNRVEACNRIANMLLINGLDTTVEDLANTINAFSNLQLDFLSNMFATSRSTNENRSKLDNSIYYGTREQSHIFELLNNSRLRSLLNQETQKKIA